MQNQDNTVLLAERLNRVNFAVPEYGDLLAKMQHQHESVAVRLDDGQPWGARNRYPVRGIIVKGHHHCGKSDLVSQCLEAIEPVVTGDGQAIEPNPRHIEAPHIFTQASQARAILAVMGYPLTRKMTADVAWSKVSDRLDKARVTQLAIDNWHWSFAPSQVGQASKEAEKRKIQAAYCQLLDNPVWPLPLIFIGLPEVDGELAAEGMQHIKDRCDVIVVGRMRNEAGEYANLRGGISKLCLEAELQWNLREEDLPLQRLKHAADEARGLAITLAKLAVLHAVRIGSGRLEIQHFRDVYARMASAPTDDANPFVSDNWDKIDTSGLSGNPGLMDTLKSMNAPKRATANAR